jgi:general stress protein 26
MSTQTIEDRHQEIWNHISEIKTGMLTTVDGDELRSRPMQVVQNSYEGVLWFFTSASSAKVFEASRHGEVNVTFVDPDQEIYISLSGTAELSRDQERIDALWNKAVELWFPNGKNGNVALLKIDIHQGEKWSSKEGALKKMYEMAKAAVTDSTPDIGKNEKFNQ